MPRSPSSARPDREPSRAGEFFTGPLSTLRRPDEIITELHLPYWPADRRWAFREFARREGDFALAGILLFYDEDARRRGPQRPCRRYRRMPTAAAADARSRRC